MLIKRYIIIANILFFAMACQNGDGINPAENLNKVNLVINAQKYAKVESDRIAGKGNTLSDSFEIESVEKAGDILKVKVSYTGGCEEHTFEVIYGGQILLTHPCQINLTLTHNAKDDACEANITEILEIDLNKLVGDNEYKDACAYNVFNVLNQSNNPDGTVNDDN